MTLSLGQMSYNGVTLGPSGIAQIESVTGLTALPNIRNADVSRPNAQGMLAGYDFMGTRTVALNLQVTATGGNTMPENLETLRAAMLSSVNGYGGLNAPASQQLAFNFGSIGANPSGAGYNRYVVARVRKFDTPIDIQFAGGSFQNGLAQVAVQLECVDPRIYDAVLQTGNTPLTTLAGGLTFPVGAFPVTFGAQTGGLITANNAGSTACLPYMTITGPCINPQVQQETTGVTIKFNLTLGASDTLAIDCFNGSAVLNGTASRTNALAAGSYITAFTLPPGNNTIGFFSQDASPTGATLTATWSNTWA